MTRLITEWITDMKDTVATWDMTLEEKTGSDFIALAAKASGRTAKELTSARDKLTVAVVPITSGEGIIGDFAQSVASIINEMRFHVFVTEHTDVAGIYEAHNRSADIIYVADDDRYIAMNMCADLIGENDRSTARGYIEALEGMSVKVRGEGLKGQEVLLLGYGRVGHEMYDYLEAKGAVITVYDCDSKKQEELRRENKQLIIEADEIKDFSLIMDATCTGEWITADMLAEDALISAPGIPFSLDEEAAKKYQNHSIHDNLEIGTAVMLASALGEDQ